MSGGKSFADVLQTEGEWQIQSKSKQISNSKLRNRFLGKMGYASVNDGKFRAAEPKVQMFITKVHKQTTDQNIVDYIYEKTQERISLQKLTIKKDKDHCAYKFEVPKNKLSLFLDGALWPQGIIFRRFVHYKQNFAHNVNTEAPKYRKQLDG